MRKNLQASLMMFCLQVEKLEVNIRVVKNQIRTAERSSKRSAKSTKHNFYVVAKGLVYLRSLKAELCLRRLGMNLFVHTGKKFIFMEDCLMNEYRYVESHSSTIESHRND